MHFTVHFRRNCVADLDYSAGTLPNCAWVHFTLAQKSLVWKLTKPAMPLALVLIFNDENDQMQSMFHAASIALIFLLLSACQTLKPQQNVSAGNLSQHNLYLTSATAVFVGDKLTIAGGIRTITAPAKLDCGTLSIEVFDQQNVLLQTLTSGYSPCLLHRSPTAKRTGYFSETLVGIVPQPLRVKISYRASLEVAGR